MYKKVRLMSSLPASISRRNGFIRKFSLVETIVAATICVAQRRFDPCVSDFLGYAFVLQKAIVYRYHGKFIYDQTIDINTFGYCHCLLQ